jgi:predicted PurR-regulated permease PerM
LTEGEHYFIVELVDMHRFIHYLLKNQVIFALLLIISGWFMLQIRDIIASIFVSYIIMASLLPIITFLRKKHIPRLAAVLIVYFGLILVAALIIVPIFPFFIAQISSLLNGFPSYINKASQALGFSINTNQLQDYLSRESTNIGANAIFVTKQVFGGIFSILTVVIVSFYLLLNHDLFRRWVAKFFHEKDREKAYKIFSDVDNKLGAWLRGQLLLCYVIGLLTWIALTIIGLPNALPLALIAAILEAFPTLGPILSSIPAIVVAFTISPSMAITVVIVYVLIQLLENNLIVPKVMQRAVGINPIIVIIGVTIGASLMGVTGALLSIPFISFIVVLINSIRENDLTPNALQ